MNLSVGIVGLPNVGKSTLFNALLKRQMALVASYPFATIEPNVGIVPVPDERLQRLAEVIKHSENLEQLPPRVESTVKFVDIAGLVSGAHAGEGLGNQFLSHIREVSVICHVLRLFADSDVAQAGSGDPQADFKLIETELLLADLVTWEKQKEPRNSTDREEVVRWQVVCKLREKADKGGKVSEISFSEEEEKALKTLNLLSVKPLLVVLNIGEGELAAAETREKDYALKLGLDAEQVIAISAKVEAALSELTAEDQKVYLQELGIKISGLERLAQRAYKTLGMISFLTAGEKECRAWTVSSGCRAQEAAGVIHTDFSQKFIKAEVVSFTDFISCGGWKRVREAGKLRIEGKDYLIKDGDVILFKVGA